MTEEMKNQDQVSAENDVLGTTPETATPAADIHTGTRVDAAALKKKARRWPIVVGVIAVIVVVAGIGLFVWHEQPSFCAAICHTPMDAYYETYADGTMDAFGNALDEVEAESMLSHAHSKYMGGITCMGCHVPTLNEQIGEGLSWVSGNYEIEGTNSKGQAILENKTLADLTEARGADEDEFCLNSTCHVATPDRASLAEKTEYLGSEYNPHLERHGEVDCGTCHKAHSQSVNYCSECHASAPVPEGWLSYSQAEEKGIVPVLNE